MYGACMSESAGCETCEWHQVEKYEICGELECTECGCGMGYGTPHKTCELSVANHEGDWNVFTTCHPCVRIRNDLYEEFIFGKLWERLGELYGLTKWEDPEDGPAVDKDWEPPEGFSAARHSAECDLPLVAVKGWELDGKGGVNKDGPMTRRWLCLPCRKTYEVDENNPYELSAWCDSIEEGEGKVKVRKPDMEAINRLLTPTVVLSESMEQDIEELKDDQ